MLFRADQLGEAITIDPVLLLGEDEFLRAVQLWEVMHYKASIL